MTAPLKQPYRDLLPPLSTTEFEALKASIEKDGVREPIVTDEDGVILDGHHRYIIDPKAPTRVEYGLTENEKVAYVLASNMRRRNLSPDQKGELRKKQVAAAEALKEEGKTQAEIGVWLGVARETVRDWLGITNGGDAKAYNDNRVKLTKELKVEAHDRVEAGETQVQIAADYGVSQPAISQAHKAETKRREREAEVEAQREAIANGATIYPDGNYPVISIDPPWPYGTEDQYDADGFRGGTPYPEMPLEEIGALAIPAADDCILWLWTTHRFLPDAFEILRGWGFDHKVTLTWAKNKMGTGRWLRSKSEFCIMAVRGKPRVNLTNQTTVLEAPTREHSRKPDEFYDMVEGLCFEPAFIEAAKASGQDYSLDYFSREKRPGWAQVGNDGERFE